MTPSDAWELLRELDDLARTMPAGNPGPTRVVAPFVVRSFRSSPEPTSR